MPHDLIHVQGKPFMLVPLHDYRQLVAHKSPMGNDMANDGEAALPADILNQICARQAHPVKILRAYRKLTQDQLAERSGLSRPYLTEIETGRKEGSLGSLRALASALDVPAGLLL